MPGRNSSRRTRTGTALSAGFRRGAFLFRAPVCFKTRQKRSLKSSRSVPSVPSARTEACARKHYQRLQKRGVCGAQRARGPAASCPAQPNPGRGGAGPREGRAALRVHLDYPRGRRAPQAAGLLLAGPKGAQRSRSLSPGEGSFPEGCAQKRLGRERGLEPLSKAFSRPPLLCTPSGQPSEAG